MDKNKKGFIAVGIILSLGALVYFLTKPPKAEISSIKQKTSLELATDLANAGAFDKSVIQSASTFDIEFLQAWAESLSNAYYTFTYKGSKYWKKGGKKVV